MLRIRFSTRSLRNLRNAWCTVDGMVVLHRGLVAVAVVVAGCTSAPSLRAEKAPPDPVRAADEAQRAPPSQCGVTEQIELEPGAWFISATGLQVSFAGTSHDSYADGGTDTFVELALGTETAASETWMHSIFAPPAETTIHDHCVRIEKASESQVTLHVGPSSPPGEPRACGEPTTPHLADFSMVSDGDRVHIDVARDANTGEWMPTPLPRMPLHHASRLAWQNLAEHPALAGLAHARFEFELIAHEVTQVAGHDQWRTEYRAKVLAVCTQGKAVP